MPHAFLAYRIHQTDQGVRGELETLTISDLSAGELLVRVEYSGINYRDALAATGKGRILRKFPLVGGIDLAGEVLESSDDRFRPGDRVLRTNYGQSETLDGGYAEIARVPADNAVSIPKPLDSRSVMGLGTAGATAALAIHRMEENGQRPENGPIVVTGATGGVGSFAIDLLSGRGYEVAAMTGKSDRDDYLHSIGATSIIHRKSLAMGTRPLEHGEWGGAIDNLGGKTLSWLTRTVKPHGNIASVGLAESHELETTVMPFILRGIGLLGINIEVPAGMRDLLWQRLATDLRPRHLDEIVTREVTLAELPACFDAYIDGTVTGRTLVRVGHATEAGHPNE